MDHDSTGPVLERGMMIVGSDGMRVGEIDLVEATYVIVRTGGFFPQDHFIPIADIVAQDADGALRLSMPADEALEHTLGHPEAAAGGEPEDGPGARTDRVESISEAVMDVGIPDVEDAPAEADAAMHEDAIVDEGRQETPSIGHEEPGPIAQTDVPERRDDDMHRTVPVVEETLDVHVRPVERGAVRVEKTIVEERQTIEVPLVEEEVEVARRRVDREIRDDDHAFEEHSIEIPLHGQAVEIEKRAQVVEEIDIDKTAHTRTEQVTETVRKESAHVEGRDVIEIDPEPGERDADTDEE